MSSPPKPSARSQRALDWLNFFVADVETGFGPFISVYLSSHGWGQGSVGLMLTAGSVCGIASQLPGGAIVDGVRSKRGVVAVALAMIAAGALILFLSHAFWLVLLAQVLHGLTAGLITPAKAAIGLGLVGHRGLSRRLGRNHQFDSYGNAGTAAVMGGLGHFVAQRASFLFAAVLCLPALWVPGPLWLLPLQLLSGIDAAVIGILSPLIIADVTAGSGRYNLAQGAVGMATGIGAALSTTATGFIAEWFGFTAGLLTLGVIAGAAFAYVLFLFRESRPARTGT